MLKNRPILMVLTGAALALLLWIAVLAFQDGSSSDEPVTPLDSSPTNAINEEYAITPASIQTVNEADDRFVITGVGVSGSGITLMNEDLVLGSSKLGADGNWVLSLNAAAITEPLKLDLLMATPDGHQVRSDQSLFIAKREGMKSLVLLTAPGEPSRVLQSSFDGFPSNNGFELEAIDYDNSGGVIFSGTALKACKVRIYANDNYDNPIGESRVDRNGRWTLIFGNTMPLGEYNISAECVPDDGSLPQKITVLFTRMEPLFEAEDSPKLLINNHDDHVELARALYGGGYQYTVIYSADALVE
jgi:hypothetical protein